MIGTVSDLRQFVEVEVPGVPVPLLDLHLRQAIVAFCKLSEANIETITEDIVAEQEDYTIRSAYCGSVKRIKEVAIDEVVQPLEYYDFDGFETLTLVYPPATDDTDALVIKAVVVPDVQNAQVAPEFIDRWCDGIVARAKSTLCAIPDRDWTNQMMAVGENATYERQIVAARIEIYNNQYKYGNEKRMQIKRDFY